MSYIRFAICRQYMVDCFFQKKKENTLEATPPPPCQSDPTPHPHPLPNGGECPPQKDVTASIPWNVLSNFNEQDKVFSKYIGVNYPYSRWGPLQLKWALTHPHPPQPIKIFISVICHCKVSKRLEWNFISYSFVIVQNIPSHYWPAYLIRQNLNIKAHQLYQAMHIRS